MEVILGRRTSIEMTGIETPWQLKEILRLLDEKYPQIMEGTAEDIIQWLEGRNFLWYGMDRFETASEIIALFNAL